MEKQGQNPSSAMLMAIEALADHKSVSTDTLDALMKKVPGSDHSVNLMNTVREKIAVKRLEELVGDSTDCTMVSAAASSSRKRKFDGSEQAEKVLAQVKEQKEKCSAEFESYKWDVQQFTLAKRADFPKSSLEKLKEILLGGGYPELRDRSGLDFTHLKEDMRHPNEISMGKDPDPDAVISSKVHLNEISTGKALDPDAVISSEMHLKEISAEMDLDADAILSSKANTEQLAPNLDELRVLKESFLLARKKKPRLVVSNRCEQQAGVSSSRETVCVYTGNEVVQEQIINQHEQQNEKQEEGQHVGVPPHPLNRNAHVFSVNEPCVNSEMSSAQQHGRPDDVDPPPKDPSDAEEISEAEDNIDVSQAKRRKLPKYEKDNSDLNLGRKKFPWTPAEEEKLKVGVQQFASANQKNQPWKKILEFGQGVFLPNRKACDLKDKWRRMQR